MLIRYVCSVRLLFVSDTHLGFDAVKRERVKRRRRSADFLASYLRALEPALEGRVDAVLHGGDVFEHPRVSAGTVDDAFAPLRTIAGGGTPVFVLAGNHERSQIPYPLLAMHPGIHVMTTPRSVVIDVAGTRVAVGGFAYARQVRDHFVGLVRATGLLSTAADVRILCVHHCIEGAVVSNPAGDFVFRGAPDVIRRRDLPHGVAAVLSGHIHRHQVLQGCAASGRPTVCYPGSVERTSLVERHETKGYMLLDFAAAPPHGEIARWSFQPLPTRPMILCPLRRPADIRPAIAAAPNDAVLHFRAPTSLRDHPALAAGSVARGSTGFDECHRVVRSAVPPRPATRSPWLIIVCRTCSTSHAAATSLAVSTLRCAATDLWRARRRARAGWAL